MQQYIFRTILFWGIAILNLAPNLSAQIPQGGTPISATTKAGYKKSNQSKVFYHDSQWWTLALDESNDRWEIWRYNGTNWITTNVAAQNGNAYRCDAMVNPATGKLYVFSSHNTSPRFHRFSYLGGTWQRDAGYPVIVSGFANPDGNNPVSLVQARNGDLWIFRINQSILQTKRSSDEGLSWSDTIHVKTGLKTANGIADATTFEFEGANYVGVAFGEGDVAGSKFGFLLHADGASDNGWTDESAALNFFNIERANNQLYVMGINLATLSGEYKTCLLGQENSLETANASPLLSSPNTSFDNLSVPAANIDAIRGLMVCGDNMTVNDIWFRHLPTGSTAPLTIENVTVTSNEVNANATYTIPLTLSSNGALTAGSSTIHFRFPANTFVPNNLTPSAILVNGTPCVSVISNSGTRQVSLVIPQSGMNLANNQNFSIVFNSSAGLLNPTTISDGDNYRVTIWTSSQPTQVNSPKYNLVAATTTVTPAKVTLTNSLMSACSTYTVQFNLGAHGRLLSGNSTITLNFNSATTIEHGALSGVAVNGVEATAFGDNTAKTITLTAPSAVSLSNNAVVNILIPYLCNPAAIGSYTLRAQTSVEPTPVTSNSYRIAESLHVDGVAFAPGLLSAPASYTIPLTLSGNGELPAGSLLSFRFPVETGIPNSIAANQVFIKDTPSTNVTTNSSLREVYVTTPVNLANNENFCVVFKTGAGLINPYPALVGDYTLTVATSVETTAVASSPYAIKHYTGIGRPIPGTTEKFDRNNQSKIFYNGGFWWATAQSKIDQQWYLWRFDGATWSQDALIHAASKNRPDCVRDAANNRVYILLPGASTTNITRLKYSSGARTVDSGYPCAIPDFAQSSDRGINLVRAANGDLWVFMIGDSTLYAKKSSNSGQTWSATRIAIKRHLHDRIGLTDAVAFSFNGSNHIGVGYAENSAPGSIFGFLRHKNTDADSIWTDETSSIAQFANTTSDDHLSMMAQSNVVFMIVKTNGGGPNTTNIGLLRRETNGTWFQYPILLSTGWTRPALAIDATNNVLYAIGTREGGVKTGEMKKVALGDYNELVSAPVDTIFKNDTDNFVNVSTAAHTVTSSMNLLVCTGNDMRDEAWYNLIPLGAAKQYAEAVAPALIAEDDFDGVQVFPNPFNPQTSFRFKLKAAAPVKLQIFNLNGQLVRTIIDEAMLPGVQQKRWNGRNQNGQRTASGVYWYRLQIGARILNGRIQMIK